MALSGVSGAVPWPYAVTVVVRVCLAAHQLQLCRRTPIVPHGHGMCCQHMCCPLSQRAVTALQFDTLNYRQYSAVGYRTCGIDACWVSDPNGA